MAEGEGPTMTFKLTRSEGTPDRVVPEEEAKGDEPVSTGREIDLRDRYSLGVKDVADHVDVTWVKVWAVIRELEIHGNSKYHHKIPIGGSQKQDCYTDKEIDLIEEAVESGEGDPQQAYDRHWGS